MPEDDHVADQRREFDLKTAALIGRRIHEVAYWDVYNCGPEPIDWDYGDWHHAVMGVELTTDQGPSCVLWTNAFYSYGVEVFHEPITEHLALHEYGPQRWPADRHDYWTVRIDQPILEVATFWERIEVWRVFELNRSLKLFD